MCRNYLFVCRLACSQGHACEWPLKTPTNVFIYRFQEIFNAKVFSELAVYTESKMIIFTSGPLQGFTFSGKFCTQLPTRRPPKLRFCLDPFALKVTCDWKIHHWKTGVELSSNFCHLSDIIRSPLRTNSLYEKPTVVFLPQTPYGHVRLTRFTCVSIS